MCGNSYVNVLKNKIVDVSYLQNIKICIYNAMVVVILISYTVYIYVIFINIPTDYETYEL